MPEKETVVSSGNMLIDAAHAPGSLRRMRLLLVVVSLINEELTPETTLSVSANDMANLLDDLYKTGSFYQELVLAAQDLRGMYVTSYLNTDGSRRRDRREINVVSECHYPEGEERVVLHFTPGIIPYLIDLQKRYQKGFLSKVLGMKSAYGIRLYELIQQWAYPDGKKKVTVEEFRQLMGIKDGRYQKLDKLKERVLNPAMQDVNERSDWGVRFGQIKTGRTVSMFQFWMWNKREEKTRDGADDLSDEEKLKSFKAMRLLGLIRPWECQEETREVTVEEFRQWMGVKDGQYQRMDKLKERIMDPAISEVNEYSDSIVRYSQKKSGRKITHFQFKVWKKGNWLATNVHEVLPDGKMPVPKDFDAYAMHLLLPGIIGPSQPHPDPHEGKKALRAELREGTIRDRKTGRIIQRRWKPAYE